MQLDRTMVANVTATFRAFGASVKGACKQSNILKARFASNHKERAHREHVILIQLILNMQRV